MPVISIDKVNGGWSSVPYQHYHRARDAFKNAEQPKPSEEARLIKIANQLGITMILQRGADGFNLGFVHAQERAIFNRIAFDPKTKPKSLVHTRTITDKPPAYIAVWAETIREIMQQLGISCVVETQGQTVITKTDSIEDHADFVTLNDSGFIQARTYRTMRARQIQPLPEQTQLNPDEP